MPKFRYLDEHKRYYPQHGLTALPGCEHELDDAPDDGRWEPVTSSITPARTRAAETSTEPSGDADEIKEQ
jgi:hypothetical protein